MIRFDAVTEVNLDKAEPKRAARKSNIPFEIDKVCPIVRTGNSAHLAVRLIRTVRGASEPVTLLRQCLQARIQLPGLSFAVKSSRVRSHAVWCCLSNDFEHSQTR